MTETKPDKATQVDAATADKVTPDTGDKPKTITTHVWAPAGGVPKASIERTAIQSVRDAIPVVYDLQTEITGAKKKTVDKVEGTEFEVTITYTEREMAGDTQDPVDLEKVVKSLEVPTGLTAAGDPDFLNPTA